MRTRFSRMLAFICLIYMSTFARAEIILIPDQYGTIQAGIDASNTGDTVLVQTGRYVENIDFDGHDILLGSFYLATLDSTYISETILDGNAAGAVLTLENGEAPIIMGFTITGGADDRGAGIRCIDAFPQILTNYVMNNNGPGVYLQNSSSLFYFNRISDNMGSGVIFINCPYPVMTGNLIFGNSSPAWGGAIQCTGSSISLIANTITSNSASSGGALYISDTSLVTLINDILWADGAPQGPEVYIDDDSYINATYSDIQGGWTGEGNIDADPMFCSRYSPNYYLARHSPCVGSGLNGENMGALGIGCEEVGVVSDEVLPDDYLLAGSYPNPFNSSCTIFFVLSHASHVEVDIFDINGRKTASLIDSDYEIGFHRVFWNATPLPSGLYFARLKAGFKSQCIKLVLLK